MVGEDGVYEACKTNDLPHNLVVVVKLLSNEMSLTIETIIDNFAKVEHRKANKDNGSVIVDRDCATNKCDTRTNSGMGTDFSMVLVKHDSARNEDHKLAAQTMNSLDVTLLCASCVYPFTLLEKATKLLHRCGSRLHLEGSEILREKHESKHVLQGMSDLTLKSTNEKKDWLNHIVICGLFDTNFTRKQHVGTTTIEHQTSGLFVMFLD